MTKMTCSPCKGDGRFRLMTPCAHCGGTGKIGTHQAAALEVMRRFLIAQGEPDGRIGVERGEDGAKGCYRYIAPDSRVAAIGWEQPAEQA